MQAGIKKNGSKIKMKNHTEFKGTPQLIRGIPRRILLMVLDLLLVVAGYLIATMLRFEFDYQVVYHHWGTMLEHLPWMLLTYAVCFWVGGLYEVMWEFAGTRDLVRLASLVCVATGIILIGNEYVHGVLFRTVICIGALLHVCLLGGIRMLWKLIRFNPFTPPAYTPEQLRSSQMPLLIVGAGNAGAWAVKLCKQKKNAGFGNPVVIVDDDEAKHNLRIQGVPVRGSISDVPALVKRYRIREIVIAIPTLKGDRLNEGVNLCNSTHCRVRMLSDPQVLDMSMTYIPVAVLLYVGFAMRSPFFALINGSGNAKLNLIVGLLDGVICRVGLAMLMGLAMGMGIMGFWLGNAFAGYMPFLIGGVYFLTGKWKRRLVD